MLSSVTLNCQVTEIFISSDCQNCTYILKVTVPRVKTVFSIFCQILSGLVWSGLEYYYIVSYTAPTTRALLSGADNNNLEMLEPQ